MSFNGEPILEFPLDSFATAVSNPGVIYRDKWGRTYQMCLAWSSGGAKVLRGGCVGYHISSNTTGYIVTPNTSLVTASTATGKNVAGAACASLTSVQVAAKNVYFWVQQQGPVGIRMDQAINRTGGINAKSNPIKGLVTNGSVAAMGFMTLAAQHGRWAGLAQITGTSTTVGRVPGFSEVADLTSSLISSLNLGNVRIHCL